MNASESRLGELRTKLLPHIIRRLAETRTFKNSAELNAEAMRCFDNALVAALIFNEDHIDEDADIHLAHLMQIFTDEGIPALEALPVIEGFVLELNQKPAAK